jgi:hypothetical protein
VAPFTEVQYGPEMKPFEDRYARFSNACFAMTGLPGSLNDRTRRFWRRACH